MLFSKPRRSLLRHSQVCLSSVSPLTTTPPSAAKSKPRPRPSDVPVNEYGVPLLPENLRSKLFSGVKRTPPLTETVHTARSELTKFGLSHDGCSQFKLPDITNSLPSIQRNNISHHLVEVASSQVKPYTDLLLTLLSSPRPPLPSSWVLQPGWTRYSRDSHPVAVDFPLERCLVLDVEVAVREDPRAVMATAVSDCAWYSWLSPQLFYNQQFPTSPVVRIVPSQVCNSLFPAPDSGLYDPAWL